jgi:hypothetical protein
MFEKLISNFQPKMDPALLAVLEKVGGGIYKRVDENRELLELLQTKAPKLLEEYPWIVGWIKSNDDFFVALEIRSVQLHALNPQFSKRPEFPWFWPDPSQRSTASL